MKQVVLFLTLFITSISFAQKKDYNLKKGYVAEGYDVVSYFDNKAEEGKKEFTTTYDGAKFKFVNQEHLNTFKNNPKKYVPQYGGWCAYALGANNTKYNINPKTFEVRDGKLYLFYNSWGVNTLKKWNDENPKELKEKADSYWNNLK
ncbi:YHS domain-containing (seleno)protein [Wenyingzhuangia aestuarii]|uniref:YHS domain-containing (seleno)protein n=1 Tax=Wenyingzhuangia aestuarii TaxID=1647582 RepID=UPI001438CF46|nr:YHS domain-containing (seleno)protein [Wenyingzhuangia aestuarii]NJB81342.1 YHS domain-containing protein [Wenyingzhuangia aestuarii]